MPTESSSHLSTTIRPQGTTGDVSAPRVVVSRAVSSPDDPGRAGVRLGLVAFTTFVTLVGLLVVGAVASKAGGDRWLGAGPLRHDLADIFVTGIRLPAEWIKALYLIGVADPVFLGAGMGLLTAPMAALAAARPHQPGTREPSGAVVTAARIGAVLVLAANVGLVIRLAGNSFPSFVEAGSSVDWLDSIRRQVATDALGLVFAVLIAVLIFRMPVDRWARNLVGTIAVATAIASIVSGAAIGGALASITTVRPVIAPTAGDAPPMIFAGTTLDGRSLLLSVEDPSRRAMTDLETVEVRGSISIGAAVEAASTADADVDQVPSRPRP